MAGILNLTTGIVYLTNAATIPITQSDLQLTSVDGAVLSNATAATLTVPRQNSPRLRFHASGWDANDLIPRNQDFWFEAAGVTANIPYGYFRLGTVDPNTSSATRYPLQVSQRGYLLVGLNDDTQAFGFLASGNGLKLVSRDFDEAGARPEFYPGNVQAISNEILTGSGVQYTTSSVHGSSSGEAGVTSQFRAYNNAYPSNVYGIAGAGLTRFIGYNSTGVLFGADDDVPVYLGNNSTIRWKLGSGASGGFLLAQADNTYDIGAVGATRPRSLYVGTNGTFGGTLTSFGLVPNGSLGTPVIVAGPSTRKVGVTSAQTLSTYTVGAADGTFEVSANILITTATTHSITATVAYTDEGNTARTTTLNFATVAGVISNAAITNVAGAVPYEGVPYQIRCKSGTTITVATTGTFTTVTYNAQGYIKQVG